MAGSRRYPRSHRFRRARIFVPAKIVGCPNSLVFREMSDTTKPLRPFLSAYQLPRQLTDAVRVRQKRT